MKKNIILSIVALSLISLTGCSKSPRPGSTKYDIDKDKNILNIQRSFKNYKDYKSKKAMAVALDKEGRYVVGYSYDCGTIESAKQIALNHCKYANTRTNVKVNSGCFIYALENNIVRPLE